MQVKQVNLTNFRNYPDAKVALGEGKTVLIGENAQGKSNFLEAIELASLGKSSRAAQDVELMRWGEEWLAVKVVYQRRGRDETVELAFRRAGSRLTERHLKVNGVSQASVKALLGQLVTVSFKSHDLNLLRGGPKFRREWIDAIILGIRPAFHDVLGNYQKIVAQRNRLLKMLFEKGRVTVSDQDQLLAWDKQLARFGSQIIKERLRLLSELLPRAQKHQGVLSGSRELLAADYLFRALETREDGDEFASGDAGDCQAISAASLNQAEAAEIASLLMKLLKERRGEEIARRQTLLGPHRDDIVLSLNEVSAVKFASQGQQRSLVLSMKLAELECLKETFDESPVLLLDDVLAELDAGRQGLLMSAVGASSQTIITTTHLSGFNPVWLEGAAIFSVRQGGILACRETCRLEHSVLD